MQKCNQSSDYKMASLLPVPKYNTDHFWRKGSNIIELRRDDIGVSIQYDNVTEVLLSSLLHMSNSL